MIRVRDRFARRLALPIGRLGGAARSLSGAADAAKQGKGLRNALRRHDKRINRRVKKLNRKVKQVENTLSPVMRARMDVGRLDYERADLYLKLGSSMEVRRLKACAKEPWTIDWIERSLRPGETLFDVGANVGAYTLVAASQHSGDVKVIAFEPGFATFASLCENVIVNGAEASVIPLPMALGNRSELSSFSYRDVGAGHALHALGADDGAHSAYRQPLLTHRLDDLIAGYELPKPNHLKLDVDGPELAVLEGSVETLRSPELRSLMIELNEGERQPVEAFLAEHGWIMQEHFESRRPRFGIPTYGLFYRPPHAPPVGSDDPPA